MTADVQAIFIGSGKGGVGKSTTAATLALFLSNIGLHVGLLDADLAGPSLPVLFGNNGPVAVRKGRMQPVVFGGVKALSTGFIAPPDRAVVWSGAMLEGALWQLIHEADWGALDVLVVDLPPGTNEVHMRIADEFPEAEVVLVTAPDDLSVADAMRALDFFLELRMVPRAVAVPEIGRSEDMAGPGKGLELAGHFVPAVRIPNVPALTTFPLDPSWIAAGRYGDATGMGEVRAALEALAKLCRVGK